MYALAASAAGMGMALAQPAEARIVYTSANIPIRQNFPPVPIDLNHDGIPDFSLANVYLNTTFTSLGTLRVKQAREANQVWHVFSFGWFECAAALPKGKLVGPKGVFQQDRTSGLLMAIIGPGSATCPWAKVKQAFLGLKFVIKGKTHYGWARVKLNHQGFSISATLTGYAYETIPNRPIITGKTKGKMNDMETSADWLSPDDPGPGASLTNPIPDTPQPASLGMLALGTQGVPLWRRKESVLST
jgi:hypothetical protein